jgi:hypothetical protein
MNELQFDVVTEANAVVLLAMARAFHLSNLSLEEVFGLVAAD